MPAGTSSTACQTICLRHQNAIPRHDEQVANGEDRHVAQALAAQAASHVERFAGREPVRGALKRITRGRLGRRQGWPVTPRLGTPWQDTVSAERCGWRQRAAYLNGQEIFAVDYQVCAGVSLDG